MACKETAEDLAGYKWNLGKLKELYTEHFWNWAKEDRIGNDGDAYLVLGKCVDSEKDIWFELVKCMWSNHRSVLQYHLKYICNNIVKPFCVGILHYAERVQEMHDLAKYLPPPSMKGESFEEANWKVNKK